MSKIMDHEDGLGQCHVYFMPDSWQEFDRAVDFLIKNGVELKHGHWDNRHKVFMDKKVAKRYNGQGRVVTVNYDPKGPHTVRGEEGHTEYEVHLPDFLR
jgi:hypothetical protein